MFKDARATTLTFMERSYIKTDDIIDQNDKDIGISTVGYHH